MSVKVVHCRILNVNVIFFEYYMFMFCIPVYKIYDRIIYV